MGEIADRGRQRQVADGGHLHNDYLFSGMRQKTAHQRSNGEESKLISMWFRLRRRVRRLGRQHKWESGHGKQHVRASPVTCFLFRNCLHSPSPLLRHFCMWAESLCPFVCPIHLESCDLTRAVMHSMKSPAINSGPVLGFPVKHCGGPLILKEGAYLCFQMF